MCLTGNAHPHWEWGCASPGIHILTVNGGCALPGMRISSPAVGTCLTENAHPHRECIIIIIYYSPDVFEYNIYIFKKTNIPSKAQARRKHFGSGAAIGTKKTAGGVGGAVSPPAGPGQSPGGGPGGEAPGSSVNLGILKP